jgi:hypothetical protein
LVFFDVYTYTLETIIQAKHKNLVVTSVQIGVNRELRPSRLIKSLPVYVVRIRPAGDLLVGDSETG